MRRELVALVLLLVILAAGGVGWKLLFDSGHRARVVVVNVKGKVEQVNAEGRHPATVGEGLDVRDRLVAGADGRAVLSFGEGAQVTLEENATVELLSADEGGVRLALEGGRVQATVHPSDGNLDIVANGQDILATDAEFTAGLDENGTLAVRSDRGRVTVGEASVGPGGRVVVPVGGTPAAADDLLLQVDWPTARRTNAGTMAVEGHTEPGATVRVNGPGGGVATVAGRDGRFRLEAPLTEGANPLTVQATSILGDQRSSAGGVERDTTAPTVQVQIRDRSP